MSAATDDSKSKAAEEIDRDALVKGLVRFLRKNEEADDQRRRLRKSLRDK